MKSSTRLSKNNSYYDRFAAEVGARSEARDFSKALDLFLSMVDRQKTILDVGCGTGNKTLKTISNLLPANAPFYFTVRLGEGAKWDQYDGEDVEAARFIQLFSENELLDAVARLPFEKIQTEQMDLSDCAEN